MTNLLKVMAAAILGLLLGASAARANMDQVKAYKASYPDEKPKCAGCHMDAMPKKSGPHDLNDYGNACVKAAKDAGLKSPDADTYKKLGPIPAAK